MAVRFAAIVRSVMPAITLPSPSLFPDPAFDRSVRRRCDGPVCGVDEAGRGPWAGPVVAAAVTLPRNTRIKGIADSKVLSAEARTELYAKIIARADVSITIASSRRIDAMNIRAACLWAMARAVAGLAERPRLALVDGRDLPPGLCCDGEAVIDGDAQSTVIAAASIVAKVTRDRLMQQLALSFPDYGFERHKGYGTKAHQAALAAHGPTIHHRRSFRPVRDLIEAAAAPASGAASIEMTAIEPAVFTGC
ncbi:ribonuclease HII [Amorphus orientalis]|uniref:Ribonuclease HII n=1 Tax=Amorphus orientalis TaxID=649198 RepID=A0AAE4AVC2_9HYPH|nr:ribonuclease HII [Amorphus orientalis]MDQ0316544.1 ribonuclease HII [Amorphus orientalis]